ncbi:MAG TPA: hypothetical protein VFD07_12050 [Candidatus Krumholzibacteria bacterium]|nr:hypothetical protein [Candidatus Krumholzibacteria bacterium]
MNDEAPEADVRKATPLWIAGSRQLTLIAALGWQELAAYVAFFSAACALMASSVHGNPVHSYADRQIGMHFLTLLFAAGWPLVVWREQSPRQRAELESLPVGRGRAIGLRVGAGLFLLLGGWIVANCVAFVIAATIGRAGEFTAVSGFAWLACAIGAAIVYLIGSAIAVASESPGRWVLALLFLVYAPPLMMRLPESLTFALRPGPRWIYDGALGFERATRLAVTEAQLDTRLAEFTPGHWLPAGLFWLAIAAALVGLASRRRVDL